MGEGKTSRVSPLFVRRDESVARARQRKKEGGQTFGESGSTKESDADEGDEEEEDDGSEN